MREHRKVRRIVAIGPRGTMDDRRHCHDASGKSGNEDNTI